MRLKGWAEGNAGYVTKKIWSPIVRMRLHNSKIFRNLSFLFFTYFFIYNSVFNAAMQLMQLPEIIYFI